MLAVFADTHETARPRLSGRPESALADADLVVHAGDFTTPTVYSAFDQRATDLVAVRGNSDVAELQERLPNVETVEWQGLTIVVTHGHEHDRTSLPLLARERRADLAIVGHTHRPAIERIGDLPVVNPGSHADPRGGPPTHVEGRADGTGVRIEVRTGRGEAVDSVRLQGGE